MKKSLISLAAMLAVGAALAQPLGRARTKDVAFTFRMGGGFPGDVNRTHPASILPRLINTTNPPRLYGDPVVIASSGTANSVRGIIVGDTADRTIYGVLVRPYPTQQMSGGMSAAIGAAAAPTSGVCDVIREGYVMARNNDFAANPQVLGGAVHVWYTASTGVHVQGGFEAVATASNTFAVANAKWASPPDANGVGEIEIVAG